MTGEPADRVDVAGQRQGRPVAPLFRPFHGHIVRPEHAEEVVTPPYETLSPARWHELGRDRPRSYHHVVAAEPGDPGAPSREEGLARGARRLAEMLAEGVLERTADPVVVVHRIEVVGHHHAGLLVEIPVATYDGGGLRRHEDVRDEKAERFTVHLRTVGAASTPALVTHHPDPRTGELIDDVTSSGGPTIDVVSPDGAHHRVWVRHDPGLVARMERLAADLGSLYVADGHHRIAASARVAAEAGSVDAPILALLAPPEQLTVRAFHRCIELDGRSAAEVLETVRERATVEEVPDAEDARPESEGAFGMHLEGTWYRLQVRPPEASTPDDPVARLDAALLHDEILRPALGLVDPSTDERLDFVPDPVGLDQLERRCHATDAVAFILRAASISDVLRVADAGRTMPPKSTWFQPKLPSGLFVVRVHHDG